jgi:lipopolysaccharide export system permease protein
VLALNLRRYAYGILPRYIGGQVLKSFTMALITLTGVIVLFMVMAEATRQGLAPGTVLRLIPYIIPGTLPYTIPVALLFAVTVVYGRIAGDNEVVAIKAAGQGISLVLMPSVLAGIVATGVLMYLSGEVIPRANHAFKTALFKDAEDSFYMLLKRDREVNHPKWPFFISVKDVQDKVLIDPTFKHRARGAAGGANAFDFVVQAEKAVVRFDEKQGLIRVRLKKAMMQAPGQSGSAPWLDYEFPLSDRKGLMGPDKKVQEMTLGEMGREHAKLLRLIDTERKRQTIAASLLIAAGRLSGPNGVNWPDVGNAYRNEVRWRRQSCEIQTESHVRVALANGTLVFVLLGAPVGLLFARRDFLSAFITCFVPIIILYYPLVLAGINMGKEGIVGPWIVWAGDLVLGVLAFGFAIPPVRKH